MRSLLSIPLVLVFLSLAGCDGDDSTGSGGSGAAGGGGSGGSGGDTGGAGGTGAGGCADTVVEVVAFNPPPGPPVAGVKILVNDFDGTVSEVLTSDSQGKACAKIPAGGSVAALYDTPDGRDLYIVVAPPEGAPVQLRVNQGDIEYPKATKYVAQLGVTAGQGTLLQTLGNCGNLTETELSPNETTVNVQMDGCGGFGKDDFAVYLKDAGQIKAWYYFVDAPKKPGEVQDLGMHNVNDNQFKDVSFSFTNVPAGFTDVGARITGDEYRQAFNFGGGLVGGMGTVSAPAVSNLPLLFGLGASANDGNASDNVFRYITFDKRSSTWITELSASATAISLAAGVDTNLSDPARPLLSWSWGAGGDGDSTTVYMHLWSEGKLDRWNVTATLPPGLTTFQVPEVPDNLMAFRPDAKYVTRQSVLHDDWDSVDSYADVVKGPPAFAEHANTWYVRDTMVP